MTFTLQQWHERFQQQAQWTAELRAFLFSQVNLKDCRSVLEVGSGTGAITTSLHALTRAQVFGTDIAPERVRFAASADPTSHFCCTDAARLPYADAAFDLTYCHYLLLWLHEPVTALQEMMRVTRPGAKVLALAEPDHQARVDAPAALEPLGRLQTQALLAQGVCTNAGRKLASWFAQAGLQDVQIGVSGFQTLTATQPAWFDSEWQVLQQDLAAIVAPDELLRLKELDRQAWRSGQRVLWIPTFYAIGTVPSKPAQNSPG
ncbi:MAG: methyltransferase domain-containing protein [Anaerolineaceae bacterium]|nr:methyltransferase domain-containing protein [Anaerolineaceae bacterium]